MPNTSLVEKVVQQVCARDYLVSRYVPGIILSAGMCQGLSCQQVCARDYLLSRYVCARDYLVSRYVLGIILSAGMHFCWLIGLSMGNIFWLKNIYLKHGAASRRKACTYLSLFICTYIWDLNLFDIGSGPDIDTVSKIGVYETIINKFYLFNM